MGTLAVRGSRSLASNANVRQHRSHVTRAMPIWALFSLETAVYFASTGLKTQDSFKKNKAPVSS